MKHLRFRWSLSLLLSPFLLYILAGHADGDTAPPAEKRPPFKAANIDYYPAQAKRLGLTGRVGLQFSIDAQGRAQNIVILDFAGRVLDDHAKTILSKGHFDVPSDWGSTGGPNRRYTWGVIYELTNKPKVLPFPDDRPVMVITGSGV